MRQRILPCIAPLMQQWREAKTRHPDALIFMRVGDFYELFNEDPVEGSRLLGPVFCRPKQQQQYNNKRLLACGVPRFISSSC